MILSKVSSLLPITDSLFLVSLLTLSDVTSSKVYAKPLQYAPYAECATHSCTIVCHSETYIGTR